MRTFAPVNERHGYMPCLLSAGKKLSIIKFQFL
jgi:hypothetical protein